MSLQERQTRLIEDLSLIENPLERFTAVVDGARKIPALPASEQTEPHLVRGCVSRVWVTGRLEDGLCRFRSDADSPILKGVVHLLTEFYSDATPEEVVAIEPDFLDSLRLTDQLTPTRRNGLRHVRGRIAELARSFLPP